MLLLLVVALLQPPVSAPHPADQWVRAHPRVATQMTWREEGVATRPYASWPPGMRERLWTLVDDVRAGRPTPVPDPAPNAWPMSGPPDASSPRQVLSPSVARDLYLSALANTLVVEIDRRVPWSITSYTDEALEALLASRSMFYLTSDRRGYEILMTAHGWGIPAPPAVGWAFLRDNGILKSTRLDTIVALVGWSQQLWHFAGGYERRNALDHWGWDGMMPVSRLLDGTVYTGTEFASVFGDGATHHYTAGCHGTAAFMLNVLRSANIPVIIRLVSNEQSSHATVIFPADDRALTHGDDPYTQTVRGVDPAEILITRATYEQWLGPLAPDPGAYIGYQPKVLAARRGAAATPTGVWIEAESLRASVTAGSTDVQDMSGFLTGSWRGSRQLWWRGGAIGAQLRLPFTVDIDNARQLGIIFTDAPDYGIVSLAIDEVPVRGANAINLFAPDVVVKELPLTDLKLSRGAHTLTITIVGVDPRALPAFMVGIDALRVR